MNFADRSSSCKPVKCPRIDPFLKRFYQKFSTGKLPSALLLDEMARKTVGDLNLI
jgi:hypothetical protein